MGAVIEAIDVDLGVRLPAGRRLSILRSLSLSVDEGTSVAILGRSGSGKTTLLTLLGLMNRPDAGTLRVGGRVVTTLSDAELARFRGENIGFAFQNFSLIDHLSVIENVQLPFLYGNAPKGRGVRQRALAALAAVDMMPFARRTVHQLSGGEQQRVAIARALVRSPAIVLADEPTGSLDASTGDHVIAQLRSAAKGSGACLVVVTHDRHIAATMDSAWELHDGALHPLGANLSEQRAGTGTGITATSTVSGVDGGAL